MTARGLLGNRWLVGCVRIFLGAVFLYAAWHKIEYPPGFAKEIVPYRILPVGLVNLWAIYLPWLEAFVGLALVAGVWRRTAGWLTAGLLGMFLVAIGTRFLRGETDFECGCFPPSHSILDDVPVLAPLKAFFFSSPKAVVTFLRDVVLLAMAALVIAASGRERGRGPA